MRSSRVSRIGVLLAAFAAAAALGAPPSNLQHPRDHEIHDSDTLAWWHTTEALSNDGMEGRDTGSAAYQRAAEYVANRFKAAGLQPAGEHGGYFQSVPMHEVAVLAEGTGFAYVAADGHETPLKFLRQITIAPAADLAPPGEAALTFRGYCGKDSMTEIAGKIVVCFGTQRSGMPSGSERAANARQGNALGIITVDDPYFTIEPPRWPYAYARSVTLRNGGLRQRDEKPFLVLRCSKEAFTKMLGDTGHDPAELLKAGGAKQPL